MPTSPGAIERYLAYRPLPPPFAFRGAKRERLLDVITRVTGESFLEKTPSYRHQLEGCAWSLSQEKSILIYSPRTGKTKISLDFLSMLLISRLLRKKFLIICHAPIAIDVWMGQSKQHSYLNIVPIYSGQTIEYVWQALHGDEDGILVSWATLQSLFSVEGIVTRGTRKGKSKLYANRPLLREIATAFDAVVIDEIHMAGHVDTLRFTIASELVARCRWRLGLTGTPFGRDPSLLFGQMKLLDERALGTNFYFFREAFGKPKYNPFSKKNDYTFDFSKLGILREKITNSALYCRLDEVQDVNILRGVIELTMSPEQATGYDQVLQKLVELRTGQTIEIDAAWTRLRQVSAGFLPFTGTDGRQHVLWWPDNAKMIYLDDFLENLPDFQIVIFYEFTEVGRKISELLNKHKITHGWLWGGETKNRAELQNQFQAGSLQVMLSNTATGGQSIDLSKADLCLYYESPPSGIVRQQSEMRPMARGSRVLAIDDLVASNVDRKILQFHRDGADLQAAMRRDPRRMAEELRHR